MDLQDQPATRQSKLLRHTRLSQHRVGGGPGQDISVYRKTPLSDQNDIPAHGASPSRSGCDWPLEGQAATFFVLVQEVEISGPVAENTVQLQQFGDQYSQFLNQNFG